MCTECGSYGMKSPAVALQCFVPLQLHREQNLEHKMPTSAVVPKITNDRWYRRSFKPNGFAKNLRIQRDNKEGLFCWFHCYLGSYATHDASGRQRKPIVQQSELDLARTNEVKLKEALIWLERLINLQIQDNKDSRRHCKSLSLNDFSILKVHEKRNKNNSMQSPIQKR